MSADLSASGIDPALPALQPMLRSLQGNILKSHGRNHVRLLLVRFTAQTEEIRRWMREFATARVTSARCQLDEAADRRAGRGLGGTFGNLFLSAQGYQALRLDPGRLSPALPPPAGTPNVPFGGGMESAGGELGDPPSVGWEPLYKSRQIHAMILLADSDLGRLQAAVSVVERTLSSVADLLGTEVGCVQRDGAGRSIEPFGFADGISQPLFFKGDIQKAGNAQSWNPAAPLDLALLKDPFVETGIEDCFGSFLVYRKLEQDVAGFQEWARTLAAQLAKGAKAAKLPPPTQALARAYTVGRFEDGTPLVLSDQEGGGGANDFDYSQDPLGARCPVQAHIRKVNPRGGGGAPAADDRSHRIVRRGVPYSAAPSLEGAPGRGGTGLLFMCFQSDIANQFAFIQKRWVNDPDFPSAATGRDALIGASPLAGNPFWSTAWGTANRLPFALRSFVTLRGGEFFFAPSLPFLLA